MTAMKYKIKIINETLVDEVSLEEAKQLADILQNRNAMSTFLGKLTITYSEIESVN